MRYFLCLTSSVVLTITGCQKPTESSTSENDSYSPPILEAPAKDMTREMSVEELMENLGVGEKGQAQKIGGKIRKVSLVQTNVKDLSPLKDLELVMLDLTFCPVSDLSPLAGMPLEELYLEETDITDESLAALTDMPLKILYLGSTDVTSIAPLSGLPLTQLNLLDAPIRSIQGVEKMPLQTLWVPGTSVSDLSPLNGMQLQSLDIARSEVTSLEPLRELKTLQRLNMEDCEVADLSPLKDLPLTRLIFWPANVENKESLEMIRNKSSLQELGIDFDSRMPPAEFWAKYDAGEFQ
jgi:Leucine-rich repeat (LRR) protein